MPLFPWNRPRQGRSDARGFTLVEVIIALVIVGLSLGALFTAISRSTAHHAAAGRASTLAVHGQSVLDRLSAGSFDGAEQTLSGTLDDGGSGGTHWQARLRATSDPVQGLVPVLITLEMAPGKPAGPTLKLETLRLMPVSRLPSQPSSQPRSPGRRP